MEGFDKYWKNVLDIAREEIDKAIKSKEQKEVFVQELFAVIFPENKKIIKSNIQIGQDDFYGFLFHEYKEINDTFGSLQNIAKYISHFPRTDGRSEKINYFKFLIITNTNETYILKERLVKFLRKFSRLYRKSKKHPEVKKTCNNMIKIVEKNLENNKAIRNNHVHVRRYSNEDIKRLEEIDYFLELLGDTKDIFPRKFIPNFDKEFKEIRSKWKNTFIKNNQTIKEMLNIIFNMINKVVFTEDGKLIYPEDKNSCNRNSSKNFDA
jgi:hypothetical protein